MNLAYGIYRVLHVFWGVRVGTRYRTMMRRGWKKIGPQPRKKVFFGLASGKQREDQKATKQRGKLILEK